MNRAFSEIICAVLLAGMLPLVFNIHRAYSTEPPQTEWARAYGGSNEDWGFSVVETSDGGYAVVGVTFSFGAGADDFWFVKTDVSGNIEWSRTYGGTGEDRGRSIIQTGDGGYALIGHTWSFGVGYGDFRLIKTDATGNMQWSKTYGGVNSEDPWSVVETSDGGYAIAGVTKSFGAGGYDFWLVKTDVSGNMQWSKTYGGTGWDWAFSVVQTNDGGYALAGYTESFGAGNRDFWLVKTDVSGNMQWSKTYGGVGSDTARFLVQTSDGGYAIAGDGFANLMKTNPGGDLLWNASYGGSACSLVETSDGSYALAGTKDGDFWLVKTDVSGNMQWSKTYGGTGWDDAWAMIQTRDKGYVVTGRTESSGAGDYDFWLVKVAAERVSATVEIGPDTLDVTSGGMWITACIELPEGYSVSDINVSRILLNSTVSAEWLPTEIGDHDNDTIPDLMVRFNVTNVVSCILDEIDVYSPELIEDRQVNVTLTLTGELYGRTLFQGNDTIRIVSPKTIVTYFGSGLDSSSSGTVLVVDGANYTYTDLPVEFEWEPGESHSFAWNALVSSDPGKRFVWVSTSGISTSKNGLVLVPFGEGSVFASYWIQYYLTVVSEHSNPNPTSEWFNSGTLITASVSSPVSGGTSIKHIGTGWTGTGSVPSLGTEIIAVFVINTPSNLTWQWKTLRLSMSCNSSTSQVGFKVYISGNLTSNEEGLSGASIQVSYSVTGGESWEDLTFVHTEPNGLYSAVWMPSVTGNYFIRATWGGNDIYPELSTIVNLAVIPFKEQSVFSVASNSTVNGFTFNSTSRKLSFMVTGASNTTGYANICLAKTLAENIGEVKVYLDGDQVDYVASSTDDSWLLHFTYQQHAHTVTVNLGNVSSPFIETPLGRAIILGGIMTSIIAVSIALKGRKGRCPARSKTDSTQTCEHQRALTSQVRTGQTASRVRAPLRRKELWP